ncbi:hypothetical protein CSB37_02170 [bacterium DOLZORAL124_38_8]|nr:MAG: hypothetical protein CSB37_02170 [bacterium DOLZORAL124_38_8]
MKNYFDAAATTPLHPEVQTVMQENFSFFGNENSKHRHGFAAHKKQDQALQKIADILGVAKNQLAISHSGTHGNQKVLWEAHKKFGRQNMFCSAVEHSSVLDEILPTNRFDPLGDFADIPTHAQFISLMRANAETGTIFDTQTLREKFPHAIIHQDAVQAVGKTGLDFENADIITMAPHKFYGPKMIGLIWMKKPQQWKSISKDTHTKNCWLALGMSTAFELLGTNNLSTQNFESTPKLAQIKHWQTQIEQHIRQTIPDSKIRHADLPRVPGIINVSFKNIRGGQLAQMLSDQEQICVSTGSACTNDILQPTTTIQFFEKNPDWQFPLRISLHSFLTDESVQNFCEALTHYCQTIRQQ